MLRIKIRPVTRTSTVASEDQKIVKTTKRDYVASVKDLISEHDSQRHIRSQEQQYMSKAKSLLNGKADSDKLLVIIMSS